MSYYRQMNLARLHKGGDDAGDKSAWQAVRLAVKLDLYPPPKPYDVLALKLASQHCPSTSILL
jgi:hypothetical protein